MKLNDETLASDSRLEAQMPGFPFGLGIPPCICEQRLFWYFDDVNIERSLFAKARCN